MHGKMHGNIIKRISFLYRKSIILGAEFWRIDFTVELTKGCKRGGIRNIS